MHHADRCRLRLFADYHQFYIWDPEISGRSAPEDWSDQDVANRTKIAPGVVVICPARNAHVPVEIGIWDADPLVNLSHWQHVIEAPLWTTGRIEVDECTGDPQANFTIEPGDYTVRALFRGLDTLSVDGLEGEDFYEVQIWRSPCASLKIIKRWE
jgi:hypothetical protein